MPTDTPDTPRRRPPRTPQTIDLTAAPATGAASAETAPALRNEPDQGEPTPGADIESPSVGRDDSASANTADDKATLGESSAVTKTAEASEGPGHPGAAEDTAPQADPASRPDAPEEGFVPPEPTTPVWTTTSPGETKAGGSASGLLPGAVAGFVAGLAGAALLVALWPDNAADDTGTTRLSQIEEQADALRAAQGGFDRRLQALEARPAGGADQAKRLDAIDARLNALGDVDAWLKGAEQTARASDAESLAGLNGRLDDLQRRNMEADKRVSALEAKPSSAPAALAAGRLALLSQVGNALGAGRAFGRDLDTLAALGTTPDKIAPLRPLADGAPTYAALAGDVPALDAPATASTAGSGTGGEGFFDRLKNSASGLVKVTRTGEDAAARDGIVAALRAGHGDVALAAVDKMSASAQTTLAPLVARVKARIAAETALGALTDDATATLRQSAR